MFGRAALAAVARGGKSIDSIALIACGDEREIDRVTMKPVSPLADFSFDYQDLLFTPAQSGE